MPPDSPSPLSLSIILINWKAVSLLEGCLDSIQSSVEGHNLLLEVIIINNSKEDSLDGLVSKFVSLRLQIVTNAENTGFAKACNQGALLATGRFLLFLNPDCAVNWDCLSQPMKLLDAQLQYGACGVQLRDESGEIARSCAQFPHSYAFMLNAIGAHHLFPRMNDGFHLSHWPHDVDRNVDHIIGAFYFIRGDAFRQLAGFDQRFLVYLEDLDLSYRLKQAGYQIRYIASCSAFHAGGGTSAKALSARLYYSLSSRLRYSRKHHSAVGFGMVTFLTLCIEPMIRAAFAFSKTSQLSVRDVARAAGWLWLDFLRTRAGVQPACAR